MSLRPFTAWLLLLGLAPTVVVSAAEVAPASAVPARPIAAGAAPAATAAPSRGPAQTSASLRNFSGMWLLGEAPTVRREVLKPEFATRYTAANSGGPATGPGVAESARQCVPSPLFGAAHGYPLRIVQTATQLALLSEENDRVHRIYLDREFPDKLVPSYAGFTVGRWEGNTLVAETRGLRMPPGVTTLPDYRVIERFRRAADGLTLEQDILIESSAYATPARRVYHYFARPDLHWQESVCEEQPAPLPAPPTAAQPPKATP